MPSGRATGNNPSSTAAARQRPAWIAATSHSHSATSSTTSMPDRPENISAGSPANSDAASAAGHTAPASCLPSRFTAATDSAPSTAPNSFTAHTTPATPSAGSSQCTGALRIAHNGLVQPASCTPSL